MKASSRAPKSRTQRSRGCCQNSSRRRNNERSGVTRYEVNEIVHLCEESVTDAHRHGERAYALSTSKPNVVANCSFTVFIDINIVYSCDVFINAIVIAEVGCKRYRSAFGDVVGRRNGPFLCDATRQLLSFVSWYGVIFAAPARM